jgi:hypothetical protein
MVTYWLLLHVFHQALTDWNGSFDVDERGMLEGAMMFTHDVWQWNVSGVQNIAMLRGVPRFNQPVQSWEESRVVAMDEMFADAVALNQPPRHDIQAGESVYSEGLSNNRM